MSEDFAEIKKTQDAYIKKKNKIIQAYYMKMEPGALISEESEINKVELSQSQSHTLGTLN